MSELHPYFESSPFVKQYAVESQEPPEFLPERELFRNRKDILLLDLFIRRYSAPIDFADIQEFVRLEEDELSDRLDRLEEKELIVKDGQNSYHANTESTVLHQLGKHHTKILASS